MGFLQENPQALREISNTPGNLEDAFDQQFGNPQSSPGAGGLPNIIQQLMATPEIAQRLGTVDPGQLPGPPMPSAEEIRSAPTRQPRRSVLDIVGGLSDVVAGVGGLQGGYQSGLDARTARERATIDDSWKNKFNVQKFAAGGQALEQGEQELSNAQRTLLGQAARGVSAVYARGATPESKMAGVLKAWPMVARQLQLTPEQSQQFVQDFQNDPEGTLAAMNASLNPVVAQGSEPKEVTLYRLAKAENSDLKFNDFLRTVQDKPITDFQEAQISRDQRREDREDRESREERNWRLDPRNPANIKAAAGAGGADEVPLTKTQRGVVNMKLRAVPNLERQLAEVEKLRLQLDDPKSGSAATGYLGGMIPGSLAGGVADKYDKAVGSLQSQIRQFTKVPGEGSISDYETRLAAVGLPTRDASAAGREQALGDLKSLVQGIKTGYTEMAGSRPRLSAPASAGTRPAGAPTPRRRAAPKAAPAAAGWKVIGVS